MTFLINQSPHRFLFSHTLRAAAREVRVFMGPAGSSVVTGATEVPSIIIMVEAVPTAWLLTPWKAETISGNKARGQGA